MRSIYTDIQRRGGVAATWELLTDGHTSHQLTAAVRSGRIVRARQGHYVIPELSQAELEAVRVGGKLTGASGTAQLKIWTADASTLRVRVPAHARALRSRLDAKERLSQDPRPARVAWSDHKATSTRTTMNALECIREVARTDSPRNAFAAVESALHQGHFSMLSWTRLLGTLPRAARRSLAQVGLASESGGESLLKFDLIRAGIPFSQQVKFPGVGRVDFLIGGQLVVEVDGWQFHSAREDFEEDRRRDAALSILGLRVLRFSYAQVRDEPARVRAAIAAAITRGDASS